MRPNKAETAVHDCHCLVDVAVRMPDRGLVFEYVTWFNCLKGITFVVDQCQMCANCPPPKKKQKQDDPPLKGS